MRGDAHRRAAAAAAVVSLLLVSGCLLDALRVKVPSYAPVEKSVWLEQNWSAERREWYHHASQGTLTFAVPYEWLIALEQPKLWPTEGDRLAAPEYLDRFGFIPGSPEPRYNEGQLPVGFARGAPLVDPTTARPWLNPKTGKPMSAVGFTCAACHTGRLTYRGTALFIDGGPALTQLGELRKAIGLSLFFTRKLPTRFNRFAGKILGEGASAQERDALRAQLDEVLTRGKREKDLEDQVGDRSVEEGFGRLDALNRIGNQVFALDLEKPENFAPYSAPVHFPRIWSSSWFDWVQYNGSIEQPMVRNAGEALGVRALINLTDPSRMFASSVDVKVLFEMEEQLAGKQPDRAGGFSGLRAPVWPEQILPPIDRSLVAQGRELYAQHCQGCHLPAPDQPEFWEDRHWSKANAAGQRYLRLKMIDVSDVGTDPAQAEDMQQRQVVIPPEVGVPSGPFGTALGDLVSKTVTYYYENQSPAVPEAQRVRMNGYRDNGIRAPLQYKARPLNGIWATPPYLHNGSVPTLFALLSPLAERPRAFYLGNREYDPVDVGYRTEKFSGGFYFDTSIRGNWNTGHEFTNERNHKGVIGPAFDPAQRRALIEYLKTL